MPSSHAQAPLLTWHPQRELLRRLKERMENVSFTKPSLSRLLKLTFFLISEGSEVKPPSLTRKNLIAYYVVRLIKYGLPCTFPFPYA